MLVKYGIDIEQQANDKKDKWFLWRFIAAKGLLRQDRINFTFSNVL